MPSLTAHLLHLNPPALQKATTHPFLPAAATSALSPAHLKAFLSQTRLRALAHLTFLSTLLSHIPVPSHAEREQSLEWRVADLLIECLLNARRELKLSEETALAEDWLEEICSTPPTVQTRACTDLLAGSTSQGRPLIVGLTLLWASSELQLRSWRYAWSKMDQGTKAKDKDIMQRAFIPNGSSAETEALVRKMGALVNKMGSLWEEEGWEWGECEAVWRQGVWAEGGWWPDVGS